MKKALASKDVDPRFLPIVLTLSLAISVVVIVLKQPQFGAQAKVSNLGGVINLASSTFIVPDNKSGGVRATGILNPVSSYVEIDCQDTDGCSVTLNDGSGEKGDVLFVGSVSDRMTDIYFKTPPVDAFSQITIGLAAGFIHNGNRWSSINL